MKRFILIFTVFIGVISSQTNTGIKDLQTETTLKPEAAFRSLIINTIITQLYFGPYSFVYGTTMAGSAIGDGKSPETANSIWALTSLAGFGISWYLNSEISKDFIDDIRVGYGPGQKKNIRFYRSVFIGGSIASIIDFKAESTTSDASGDPIWRATTPEVTMATSLPSIGYRLGITSHYWNSEIETAIISHHTVDQTITYDAVGVPIGKVDLPDRFLMLHSMSMGANFFIWLPEVIVKPYIGIGGSALLNSSQSQYPGPANLTVDEGKLALDRSSLGWGFYGIVGFRRDLQNKKFMFFEFRPVRNFFKYESGQGQYEELDRFTLQYFEVQLGLGFYFF